jgi:two-component system chemotaxis response regulator CheB
MPSRNAKVAKTLSARSKALLKAERALVYNQAESWGLALMAGKTSTTPDSANARTPAFPLVVIASSAGGLAALRGVLAPLPRGFGAAILVVQHLERTHLSVMADIIGRHTELAVRQAKDGDAIEPGVVLIAPPNRHLLVSEARRVHLTDTGLVHFVRPSADVLFESAAAIFGDRVIGVVLTGTGTDGSTGVTAVKGHGGTVIAQDEASSEFFGMPAAAAATGDVDYVLPLTEIPTRLIELAGRSND